MSEIFLLDANPLIEAKNRYYGFDLCPGFWIALLEMHKDQRVYSLDRVHTEIMAQHDELTDWAKSTVPDTFFLASQDLEIQRMFSRLMDWVYSQPQFSDPAKAEFASVADGWIIAYAAVSNMTVVSHESFQPDVRRRVPIPNVCLEFDIPFLDTFSMLRRLNIRFNF